MAAARSFCSHFVRRLKTLNAGPPDAWNAYVRRARARGLANRRVCGRRQTLGRFSRILEVLSGDGGLALFLQPRDGSSMAGAGLKDPLISVNDFGSDKRSRHIFEDKPHTKCMYM